MAGVNQHKGLRARIGGASKNLSITDIAQSGPFRIRKGGITYDIWTVNPADPWASPVRGREGGATVSFRYLTQYTDELLGGSLLWNNITANVSITAALGQQQIRLRSTDNESREDWTNVDVLVYSGRNLVVLVIFQKIFQTIINL